MYFLIVMNNHHSFFTHTNRLPSTKLDIAFPDGDIILIAFGIFKFHIVFISTENSRFHRLIPLIVPPARQNPANLLLLA